MALDSIQQLLSENSKDSFLEASEILLKFASNVLKNPNDPKYRKIRVGNPVVQTKLLPVSGALECLFEMGFLEDGDFLTMPATSRLNRMQHVYDELVKQRQRLGVNSTPLETSGGEEPNERVGMNTTASVPSKTTCSRSQASQASSNNSFQVSEAVFLNKIQTNLSHVLLYEDANLQRKAREIIPLSNLQTEADKQLKTLQHSSNHSAQQPPYDAQDFLLLALLNWFKTSFFRWVDAPQCDACSANTTSLLGGVTPSPAEQIWGAARVENYRCSSCNQLTRFPRYNHPGKLLETRRGRCGEWANCFTLCCRAVGFEARYVLDWTDHVWTEVYSRSQSRWMHCDACENICDKPLLYEAGWKKKLTYVLAFSRDEVQDVTWRYTTNHEQVLARRTECREHWLLQVIHQNWKRKLQAMSEERRHELTVRLVSELVEFTIVRSADGQNLSGRTSGSLAWRESRGEVGAGAGAGADPDGAQGSGFMFTLTEEEKKSEFFHVSYSCAGDVYHRASSGGVQVAGWQSCVNEARNLARKEERDWRMVYIARQEGSAAVTAASVSWKFDFTDTDLKIGRLQLKAQGATFENGVINWQVRNYTH
ncbi:peptide-N(4)-(N-acetyl-beta-glucosaminyl)asparagine amidase-like isoform X2 [Gigantopelta aegis]|uniref:peptide-N(4)-(N-acetyl-beta- glucosaminyl)asparagine amidase-like isoform X2 n=1 Tax=Gigantopelta aegis TaxID=1735272 RepID=UPI001B8899E7|nr:peptide-N(4)-(N-acetyl-beta-glucosaminyl)asparagine amidase-like isoform X2 [Gigantopelta aegis]